MPSKELMQLIVQAAVGVSLAINGSLIQGRVEDMTKSIEKLNDSMTSVQVDHARMSKEVDLQHNWINSHHDRLQYVEAAVNKFQGYFERRN